MNREEKHIPDRNNSQKDNSNREFNLTAIRTEADFFEFQDKCNAEGIFGIKKRLEVLSKVDISPEMRKYIMDFYRDDAINNQYDQEALDAFRKTFKSFSNLYFPGPIYIVEALNKRFHFRTVPEIGTDKEPVYYYNGQIYERAEETIKAEAHREYIRQWKEMLAISDDKELNSRLKNALDRGPSANDINEVISMIRRTTFTHDEMNPGSHIPFLNGLLNLQTGKLEPFRADLFYTYQINASLLDRIVTLKDVPMFSGLLHTAFYRRDIPTVLSYFAYSFYPDLPVHKTLFILGRERIGKGTLVRIIQGLMPKGSGSISLARLLTSDRFQFTGIEGKNLLIDSETKRKFKRGTIMEWSAFCNLFGKDVLSVEPKGHEAHDYVSKAKGIFLGNLPFIPIDSPPAISRMLVVVTRDERPKKVIPDLDKKILDSERDQIATLLMQILFKLMDRDFVFPGQLSDDETAELIEKLADPVENFIEEQTEYDKESTVPVDEAHERFEEWCKSKGIPTISRQTFVKKFGRTYQKKRIGTHGKGGYVFLNCILYEEDLELKAKTTDQVGTQSSFSETLKIRDSDNSKDEFQHASHDPSHVREENADHDHNIKVKGHKLEPDEETSGSPENKAPVETKKGSNLYQSHEDVRPGYSNNSSSGPVNPDVQNENSGFYRYRVLKDFSLYGRTYHPPIEFVFLKKLNGEVSKGNIQLVEEASTVKTFQKDDKDHKDMKNEKNKEVRAYIQNEKRQLRENPKKALFDLVEIEAPKARYHSLLPKAIFDMIPDPEMTVKRVYDLCEQLTDEGAFLKNKIGAYSVNTEFLNGGGYE